MKNLKYKLRECIISFSSKLYIFFLLGILVLITPLINISSYTIGSLFLIGLAILSYIKISHNEDNYASLAAVFSAVWIGSIGLANFKIMDYQRVWGLKTWIAYSFAYIIICCCIKISSEIKWTKTQNIMNKLEIDDTHFSALFGISTIFFIFSFLGFLITIKICGFIPFFTNDILDSYSLFYSKFFLITHFAMINIPFSYIVSKKTDNKFIKVLLYLYIFVQTFVIPTLSVNRGIFMVGSLMLTITIFYLNNKKLSVLMICIFISFAGFELGSIGRNYTNEMLNNSFKQAEHIENNDSPEVKNGTDPEISSNTKETENTQEKMHKEEIPNKNGDIFEKKDDIIIVKNTNESLSDIPEVLPSKLLFLYSYLTVSHDNMDLAIKYNTNYSYGKNQLKAFNFIFKRLENKNLENNAVHYRVQSNLTTENLLGTSFYDFGNIGMIIFCIIFGTLCGISESLYKYSHSYIALMFLSIMSYCVILSFFSNYTSQVIFVINIIAICFIFSITKLIIISKKLRA